MKEHKKRENLSAQMFRMSSSRPLSSARSSVPACSQRRRNNPMGGIKPHSWMREARKFFCNFSFSPAMKRGKISFLQVVPLGQPLRGCCGLQKASRYEQRWGERPSGFWAKRDPRGMQLKFVNTSTGQKKMRCKTVAKKQRGFYSEFRSNKLTQKETS